MSESKSVVAWGCGWNKNSQEETFREIKMFVIPCGDGFSYVKTNRTAHFLMWAVYFTSFISR